MRRFCDMNRAKAKQSSTLVVQVFLTRLAVNRRAASPVTDTCRLLDATSSAVRRSTPKPNRVIAEELPFAAQISVLFIGFYLAVHAGSNLYTYMHVINRLREFRTHAR